MNRKVSGRVVGFAAVGIHVGLAIIFWIGGPRLFWGDENAYLTSAVAVLQGDPSWWPVPLWPPLYPRFLAGLLVVSGYSSVGIAIFQTFLLFVASIVFGDLVHRWTGSRVGALAAFLMMVGFPPLAVYSRFFWPEVLHLSLALIAVWVLVVRRDHLAWLALAGVCLGLALLTKSLLGPFLPILFGAAFIGDQAPRRVLRLSVCVISILAVVGPVIGIQYQRVGVPVVADSSAFNMWVGLTDRGLKSFEDPVVAEAYQDYMSGEGTFSERNARMRRKSLELIKVRGVVQVLSAQIGRQYFRLFDKDCYLTEQIPGGAASKDGAGFTSFGPKVSGAIRAAVYSAYALVLLTAPLGFLVWPFADKRWPRVLLVFLLYNLVLFLVLHVKSRYRIQILPVFFLGSSAAVAWFEAGLAGRFHLGDFKGRIALSGLFSMILLYLAF